MQTMFIISLVLSAINIALTVYILTKIEHKIRKKTLDDASLDLTEYGIGLIRIERLDPESVMIRQVGKRK